MFKKRFLQAKPFLALGILVAGWTLLPVIVKSLTRVSFYEFQAPSIAAPSYIRDLQSFWSTRLHSRTALFEAGRDLARLNANYELGIQENDTLRQEIAHLENLLKLPAMPDYRYEIARVARRDVSTWWQQIVIRKGKNYHITVGAPVVFTGGVVGRVREVHAYTSVVELVSSPHLRLACYFDGDSRPFSYQGAGNPAFHPPLGQVDYIPSDIQVSPDHPRRLVTSGLGGVFPAGLYIGTVDSLKTSPDGLFKSGQVTLDRRLNSLSEVAVLLPWNQPKE